MATNAIIFAALVTDGTNNIGGQLAVADGTNTSQGGWGDTYDNVWDLIKYLCEGSRQKVLIDSSSFTNSYDVRILKMFDEDTTHKSAAQRTLTKADLEFIDEDSGADHSDKIVSQSSTNFDSVSNNDITELELFKEGILSQNSFDSDLLLHNHPLSGENAFVQTSAGSTAAVIRQTSGILEDIAVYPINRLYYHDSPRIKQPHETCDIDYGDSITKSNSTITAWPAVVADAEIVLSEYNASVLKRTQFTGLGNLVGQSILDLMANSDQYIVTATCKSTLVDINDLGNIFTIDIDEIKNDKILITYPKATTTTILVSVEEDPVKEISKCKFFIRGTNSI